MIKSGFAITGTILVAIAILAVPVSSRADYVCGDTNGDATVNISDAVFLMGYLFVGGMAPFGDGDVDQCGSINMSDIIYLFNYAFNEGPAPCEGSVTCEVSTGNNAISLGCPVENSYTVDSFSVPVYMTSDVPILGGSFGFKYNSPDIEISSLDRTGSVMPTSCVLSICPDPDNNNMKIAMYPLELVPAGPQTNGLLFNMWFTLNEGASAQEVDIDTFSNFLGPDIEFILSAEGGGTIHPNYVDCGTSDIILTEPSYICGDANSDKEVNISDAVYIINYVFVSGNAPDPIESANPNCDDTINVSDAVWMINYVFAGGNAPCDIDGDGLPDC